jgi:hypothetical protein
VYTGTSTVPITITRSSMPSSTSTGGSSSSMRTGTTGNTQSGFHAPTRTPSGRRLQRL